MMFPIHGDGAVNHGYGLLCSSGEQWWSAPGINTCDSFTGSLTCSLEELEGIETGTISVPGATSFDVEGNWLWVARGRRLEGYDVHDASAPLLVAELRLPGTARDVKLKGGYAYVACDRRVMIVDVRNPSDPYVVSEMATCGTAREVDIVDSTLAIASSGGIGIIGVSVPSAPRGLGMLWVHEAGRETITREGRMDECSQINEEEQDWIDEQGIFGGFGRIFEGENHALYAASRHALMSFYIMNSGMPSLAGRLDFRSPIEAMRVFGNFAYLAVRPHGYVIVDVSDSGNMLEAGSHDLAWWVSGQEIEKDRVYVLDGNTLKIAMVSPEMGWIWQ